MLIQSQGRRVVDDLEQFNHGCDSIPIAPALSPAHAQIRPALGLGRIGLEGTF